MVGLIFIVGATLLYLIILLANCLVLFHFHNELQHTQYHPAPIDTMAFWSALLSVTIVSLFFFWLIQQI